jgi:hypothetical protein
MTNLLRVLLVTILAIAPPQASELKRPEGWKVRFDRPGFAAGEPYFVSMSGGWQLSSESPVIAYETEKSAKGAYKLESEMLLFPADQNGGYGLFVGGSSLDSNELSYMAFELRRDGKFSIWSRKGPTTREIVPWTSHPAILALKGTEPVKNVLAIEVHASEVVFSVNGRTVYLSGRTNLPTDGNFGFHISETLNIHANTLSLQNLL